MKALPPAREEAQPEGKFEPCFCPERAQRVEGLVVFSSGPDPAVLAGGGAVTPRIGVADRPCRSALAASGWTNSFRG